MRKPIVEYGNLSAMRGPVIHYRRAQGQDDGKIDVIATCVLGAAILLSTVIWALAVAKLVDLYSQI